MFSDSPAYDLITGMKEGGIVRIEETSGSTSPLPGPPFAQSSLRAEAITLDQLARISPLLCQFGRDRAPRMPTCFGTRFTQHIAVTTIATHAELRATVQSLFDDIGSEHGSGSPHCRRLDAPRLPPRPCSSTPCNMARAPPRAAAALSGG